MRTIHKYELRCEPQFCLELPEGAQVLCVQVQQGKPFIWALVEKDNRMMPRRFALRGTGHICEHAIEAEQYVGSFQLEGGNLVFHLFEEP